MNIKWRLLVVWCLTLVLFGLCQKFAFAERGYFAYGGEWLIWLFPYMYSVLAKEKRFSKKIKKGIDK